MYNAWYNSKSSTSNIWQQLASDWLMPAAALRRYNKSVYGVGSNAGYWLSSPDASGASFAHSLGFNSSDVSSQYSYSSSYGFSVRCVKNSPNSKTLTIHANWWAKAVVVFTWTAWNWKFTTLWTPTRAHSKFEWWYSNVWLTNQVITWNTVVNDLYAKWSCDTWYEPSWNSCIPTTYTITYVLDWWTVNWTNPTTYTIESNAITLKNPTKTGYTFLWWSWPWISWTSTSVTIPKWSINNRTYTANWQINQYTVTYIDYFADSSNSWRVELWRTTRDINYNTVVNWSDIWSNAAISAYYDYYVYESSTSATVTTAWATVHRYFWARTDLNIYAPWATNPWWAWQVSLSSNGTSYTQLQDITTSNTQTVKPYGTTYYIKDIVPMNGSYEELDRVENLTKWANDIYTYTPTTAWTSMNIYMRYKTFDIHYELNWWTVSTSNPTTYRYDTDDITLNNPEKDYYTFIWWTGTDLSEETLSVTIPTQSYGEREYTANYTPITYGIQYHLNWWTVSPLNPSSYNIETPTFILNNPTRNGYTFRGWTGTTLSTYTTEVQVTIWSHGPREYWASWNLIPLTITLNLDGWALPANQANTINFNVESDPITLPTPTKQGYTFLWWKLSGTNNEPSLEVTVPTGTYESKSYDAVWQINQYTYTLNSAQWVSTEWSTPSWSLDFNTLVTLNWIQNIWYTWLRWQGIPTDLTGDQTQTSISTNTSFHMPANSATITPVVRPNTATVIYNTNEPAGTKSPVIWVMTNQTFTYDEPQSLNENTYQRTWYTYLWWNEDQSATTAQYTDQQTITQLTWADAVQVHLYAIWQQNEYIISYDLNENWATVDNKSNPTLYTVEDLPIAVSQPSKVGYHFDGWTVEEDGVATITTPTKNYTIPSLKTKNITLIAHWTPITYTIHFDNNSWEDTDNPVQWTMANQTLTYDAHNPLNPTTISRDWYTFMWWTQSPSWWDTTYQSWEAMPNLSSTQDDVITLYAQWYANIWTRYTVNHYFQNIERNGYNTPIVENKSWTTYQYTDADPLTNYEGFHIPSKINQRIKWDNSTTINYFYDRIEYNFILDVNGWTPTYSPTTKFYQQTIWTLEGTTYVLPTPSRVWYEFWWWRTVKDETNVPAHLPTSLKDKEYTWWMMMPANDLYLYADWHPILYTLTLNANWAETIENSNETPSNITLHLEYDELIDLSDRGRRKQGYTFSWWNTIQWVDQSELTDGTHYDINQELSNLTTTSWDSKTFYAEWLVHHYTIHYHPWFKWEWSMDDQTFTYNETWYLRTLLPARRDNENNFTRIWYHFTGWSLDPAAAETGNVSIDFQDWAMMYNYSSWDNVEIDLYAVWEPNTDTQYTIYHEFESLTWEYTTEWNPEYIRVLEGTSDSKVHVQKMNRAWFTFTWEEQEITIDPHGTTTITYRYTRNSYPLTLTNGTGVESANGSWIYKYQESVTLTSVPQTWYSTIGFTWDYEEDDYTDGTFTMPAKSLTLEAIATPHTYTFTFHPWELWVWEDKTQTFTYNKTGYLNTNTYTRTWYHFIWWWETEELARQKVVKYLDHAEIYNITSDDGVNYNLYAIWAPNPQTPYTVQYAKEYLNQPWEYYVVQEDTKHLSWETDTQVQAPLITYPWFITPDAVSINIDPDWNKVHTYNYNRKTITISFDTAGWTEVQAITWKYEANLPEVVNPIKTGYTFSWWHPHLPATFPAEDETHTGTRTLNTYDIHYDLNKWERAKNEFNELIDNPNTYTFEDDTITLNNPVREGYTFRAWTGYVLVEQVNPDTQESTRIEQPLTPSETMTIPSHSIWEIYFFAEWMANTNTPYTVYHKVQDLDDPEHYTLRDTDNEVWETDTEVTPPVKTYDGFTAPATQTKTILPWWHTEVTYNYTRNAYPIVVYSERGVARIEWLRNTDYKYEEPVNLTPILFPWYTFIEFTWDYDTGTFIMPANQVNLETLVSINTYNITYNYDGWELPYVDGVQLTNPATFTVETEDREIYAPYKTWYTFYGWTWSWIWDETNDIQLGIRLSDWWVQDRSFTAIYTPNTDTLYTVRHNIETLQAGHYENYEEYTANWTTNTLVTPEPIEIDWFWTLAPISTTIKPDGSTVINYNYPRLSYTLTINKDNGDDIIEQSYKYQEPIVYPSYPDQFVKTWHNFLYWDNELSTMPSIDQTSTAIWDRLSYTLSWDVNSWSFIWVDPLEVENGIYAYNVIYEWSIAAPLVERTWYTFNWWQPELPATMPANATGSQAQWLANLYTVTFHANNWEDEYVAWLPTSSAPKVQNFVYDTPQNLLANTYTRVGYGFSWWLNMQNNNRYTNSELVENLTTTSWANINLYAQWKADGFNVTYNPNWAEWETYTEDVNYDDDYTIKPSIFTKTWYHFTHYTTQSNWDWESFDANQNITWNYLMDKTLYAQWEKNNYTITYHANNALPETDDNEPLVRNQTYDITWVIEENPFNKTGYHFVRWDTDPEWTWTSYAVSQEIINLLSEENANLDLYAIWEPNTYTLHFDGNTHTAWTQSDITDIVYDTNIAIPQSTFIKEWYTFTWWNTQPDGNWIMYQPSQVTSNLATSWTTTLYAIWQINQYKVIFNTAWWTPIDTIALDYNSVLEEPTRPIKTWHTFNSWQGVTFPYTIPAHDTQVTVFWQINTYNIIYHPNGWTGTNLLTTAIYDQDYHVEWTTFVKTWYSFTHWNTQPDDLWTKYYTWETIHWLFTENKDLYAQWRENSYTLHIKWNNEDNDETTVHLDYEENYTIPAINDANINFHRTGYTFSWWNTEPDGNWIRYAPWDTVNHLSSWNNSDANLYAIWTVNQYTIHFNSAGWTPVADITQDYNTEVTAPEDPIRTGFTFAWWNPNVPATMPAEETTLTAKWTRNNYTISFDTDWWTPIPNITGEYESPVTPPDDPTKTGYTFSWWNKPIPATIPAVAVNIKALWLKNKYQVSYHANNALPETNENAPQVQGLYYDNEPVQVLANTFTRNGYTRNSWNTSSDGNGTWYQSTSLLQNLTTESWANINFYAQWTENHYSISYNLNWWSAINPEDYTVTTETFTLTNPTKYWYDFAGWKGTDQSTPTLTLTIPKWSVGDRSYEATWTPHRRTVYYEYSGNLYVKYENRAYDTTIPVPDLHPTVEGYTFSHWDNTLTKMPDNDLHINAIWTTNTHNVSYNDGETVLATKTDIEYGTDLADLSSDVSIPTKEGYTFSHWIYPNTTMPDEDIIIQASWNINHHTVYYKYWDILIDTISNVAYHDAVPATSNEPTRHGYTFSWWNYEYEVMPDHDITVQPLWRINKRSAIYMWYNEVFQTIPDIEYNAQVPVPTTTPTRAGYDFSWWTIEYTQMPDNDITIQPQWKIHKRKITYMWDNQVHQVFENVEYDSTIPVPTTTPTKEGYTFSSWNTSLTHMPDNDVVIEPRRSINYHTVYYKYWDTIIDTIPHVAYHSPIPTTTNEPSRVGYDFSWWNYEYEIMPDSDITIQPLWNIHKRRATYMWENWIYAVIEDIPYSGSIPTPHTNPTKTGYTFSWWINPYTQMPDNNITITPTWKANTYEIAYNSNGWEWTMPTEQAVYDISQNLTGNTFTREGYTFSWWNMSSVGQGTGYEDEAEVVNLAATSWAKVILYAQWSPNSYEIKWMNWEQELTGLILKCWHALPNFTAWDLWATKAWYEFNGWSPNLTTVPPHDAVLQIQRKEKKNDTPSWWSNWSSSSSSSSWPSSSSNTSHNNSMNNNSNNNSHSSAWATWSVNTGSVTLKSLRDRIRNWETQNHKSAEEKTTTRETTKVNTPWLIYSWWEVRVTERYWKIILTRWRTAVLVDALITVYPELIENKPIINENCREFEDLRSFSKKEADSIEKLCKLWIMWVHNSDKTPIPVFNVDRVVRENEFYLVMQRLLSWWYEYLMTQEIMDLEWRTEDLKFEVLFNSFMRIKAEISKQEEEHWSPVEKQDQNRSRRVEEEDYPEKLKEEDDDEDENEWNNEWNNNEANDEKEKKPTLKSIKDSLIKK